MRHADPARRIGRATPGALTLALAFALAAVILLAGPSAAAPGAAQTLSQEQYHRLLQQSQSALTDGIAPGEAKRLDARWRQASAVRLNSRQTLPLDTQPLRAALRTRDSALLDRRLRAMSTLIATTKAQARRSADRADQGQVQVQAILRRPEFVRAAAADHETWWDRWKRDAGRWLRDLLHKLLGTGSRFGSAGGGTVATLLRFVLLFLAVAGALAALLIYALNRRRAARRRREFGRHLPLLQDTSANPAARASDAAAGGDYRLAIRLIYIAALRALHQADLLIPADYKTNWEYQRELRATSPAAYEKLLPLTRLFDRVWYGNEPAAPADWQMAHRVYETLPIIRERVS